MSKIQFYATGRRKTAAARVWLTPGSGKITVNGKNSEQYFAREVLQMVIAQPLNAVASINKFDITATIVGGGLSGQAGALRHGISRALAMQEGTGNRIALKSGGFLTRDARMVERKKYGQAGARKRFQFSKR